MKKLLAGLIFSSFMFAGVVFAANEHVVSLQIATVPTSGAGTSVTTNTPIALAVQAFDNTDIATSTDETLVVSLSDGGNDGVFTDGTVGGNCNVAVWDNESDGIVTSNTRKAFCYSNVTAGQYTLTASAGALSTTFDVTVTVAPSATIVGGDSYSTLQAAVTAAVAGDTIELDTDMTLTQQVTVNKPLTIDGMGHTLFAPFAKTDNDNNAAIGVIGVDGAVVIQNLTIDGTGSTGSRHGINTFESNNITLDDVTLINNNAAGLIVNSSTVTANDLNTSGNVWYGVNVDKNATLDAVFTLTGNGVIAEAVQIITDKTVGATVTAEGYDAYTIDGTTKTLWTNKALTSAVTIEGENVIYLTLQAAIAAASSTDTLNVGSGTYSESILIDKTLTIVGVGVTKPIITGTSTANYIVKVDTTNGVVLDNLEINGGGSVGSPNSFNYGVFVNNAGTSTSAVEVKNSTIKNVWNESGGDTNGIGVESSSYVLVHDNVVTSFRKNGIRFVQSGGKFYNNTVTGDSVDGTSRVQNLVNLREGSDVEIYSNNLSNGITDSLVIPTWDSTCIFVNAYPNSIVSSADIHDNEISFCDTGIVITSVFAATDNSSATVTNNNLHNLNWGINLEKNTGSATVHNNKFAIINKAINAETSSGPVASPPAINAENNWWGTPVLAEISALVYEGVNFEPWYMNAGMTVLSDAFVDDTITVTTGSFDLQETVSGEVGLPDGATQIILSDTSTLDLSAGLVDDEVVLQSGVADEDIVLTNSNLVGVSASILDGTTITGPTGWDGLIAPPTSETPSGDAPAGFSVGSVVISVGSPDGRLDFDSPVTLLLSGVTGPVGYKPSGLDTWVQITNVCDDYASPSNPPPGSECSVSNGTDTKIVTFHFTQFGNLNVVTVAPVTPPRSSRAGDFSPAVRAAFLIATPNASPVSVVGEVLGVTTIVIPGEFIGQVLGAANVSVTILSAQALAALPPAEKQAYITSTRSVLVSKIMELISLLQEQLAAANN
jgi:hypothetical protein